MSTADRVVGEAAKHLGYTEYPAGSNCNKFSAALQRGCQPWCADFLVYCARVCNVRFPSESSYTPTMAHGFREAGGWGQEPRRGAVAFFDFPDSKNRIQHVGVVEQWTDTTVTCVEGNTSSGWSGSQDNGGGVFRRTRPRTYVVGYGYPAYKEDFLSALSDAEQRDLYAKVNHIFAAVEAEKAVDQATNAAMGRVEVAIRDPKSGVREWVRQLLSKH